MFNPWHHGGKRFQRRALEISQMFSNGTKEFSSPQTHQIDNISSQKLQVRRAGNFLLA
jgi:hypothetical protein